MLTPGEFSRVLLPHGITTVMTDPHEIANVAGAEGIQFMLDDAQRQIWIFCDRHQVCQVHSLKMQALH